MTAAIADTITAAAAIMPATPAMEAVAIMEAMAVMQEVVTEVAAGTVAEAAISRATAKHRKRSYASAAAVLDSF